MQTDDHIVHVVDDEEASRKSLAFLLTMSGFAVRVHASATEFLVFAKVSRSGVLITDLRMPDMSGVDLIKRLADARLQFPSIVITGHGDVPMAVDAMKAGALDFIEKPFDDTVIINAIRRASERLSGRDFDKPMPEDVQKHLESLSDRERQVLTAVVAGLPNKSIAYDLDISPRTVEVHRANVMSKMKARSLPELVRMTMAAGIMAG
jgi:two-component system response regulator FixJ